MDKVRVGIIGMGNIGKHHASYLMAGKVKRCELVAVCSTSPSKLESYEPVKIYGDAERLIKSGNVDAVLIATPHYQHTTLGIAALEAGLHIMVEKPISAHKADAERLICRPQETEEAGFCGNVPVTLRAALFEDPEIDPEWGVGRHRATELDHDGLVSDRGLLFERRMASDLEGGGWRSAVEPMPAQSGCAAMAVRHAIKRARVLPVGTLS